MGSWACAQQGPASTAKRPRHSVIARSMNVPRCVLLGGEDMDVPPPGSILARFPGARSCATIVMNTSVATSNANAMVTACSDKPPVTMIALRATPCLEVIED